jgi:transcriptional regulator
MPEGIDLMRGTLDLLILRALVLTPLHGLGIARRISQITRGSFDVKAGSLFPALYRLEERGLITSEWGESDTKRRAKFYSLTRLGGKQLRAAEANWRRVVVAMDYALKSTP